MTAGGGNKLPFGNIPRLLLAWVSTEAGRTQSRVLVLGKSLFELMRKLDIYGTSGGSRGERTRLRNQMRRLFNAHVQLVYEDKRRETSVSSSVADRTDFWWNEREIRLGEDFFNEIISHPVPIDMNILTALKRSSLGLDLYLWLVYRTFTPRAPKRITWRLLYSQFGAHPAKSSDKVTVQAFRRKVLRELKKIKMAWPGLNYSTAPGLLILHPSIPAIAPVEQAQLTS